MTIVTVRSQSFFGTIFIASLIAVHTCFAQQLPMQLQSCEAISDNTARLQCFDTLAKGLSPAPPPNATSDSGSPDTMQGDWFISQSSNPLDDTKTIILANNSTSGTDQLGHPIGLIIRCQSGQTDAFINWNDFLGDDDVTVTTRIGSAPAQTESWNTSTDHLSSFSPSPIELIQQMLRSSSFVAQVTPYDESPITAVFDTSGLAQVIKPLAQDCHLQI